VIERFAFVERRNKKREIVGETSEIESEWVSERDRRRLKDFWFFSPKTKCTLQNKIKIHSWISLGGMKTAVSKDWRVSLGVTGVNAFLHEMEFEFGF
jgi:hypothetical protein